MPGLNIRDDMIMIDVACNDPDSGVFAGRAEQIRVVSQFEIGRP